MRDSETLLLDKMPQAAVLIQDGRILAANLMARLCLSKLKPGGPLPGFIPQPAEGAELAGTFSDGQRAYVFRWAQCPWGPLLLFAPAPQTALTDGQLDSALRQARELLAELLANAESGNSKAVFYKNFHRLFRLVENLEFIRSAKLAGGVRFNPVTMDLAGLCREVTESAAPFLDEAGVSLEFQCSQLSLLIPGDPDLLQKLLLELLSNAVRASTEKKVVLRLQTADRRAVLVMSARGEPLNPRQLAAILQPVPDGGLPEPGAGAGLGLTIARHIAALHGGSLLVGLDRASPSVAVALPAVPLEPRATVEAPRPQDTFPAGGLSPVLVALADVLPARLFFPDDEEG